MATRYGLARVSTNEQTLSAQIDALRCAGVTANNILTETISGTKTDRPALNELRARVASGDIAAGSELVVVAIDRLGRSTLDVLNLLKWLGDHGVKVVSLREGFDTSGPIGAALLQIIVVVAELEAGLIRSRTKASLDVLRERIARGETDVRLGRPRRLTPAVVKQISVAHDDPSITPAECCRALGISKSSYYNALRQVRTSNA